MAAHSLGVGEIKLHSTLNQKLNAEIALSLSAGEHVDDIRVNLATPDQFEKLGIAWNYFISKVKFKPIVKSNGKTVIQVTSDQVLQEPILDFLVEVSWPNGEIYKEYTVLIDPPVVYQQGITDMAVVPTVNPQKSSNLAETEPTTQNDFNSLTVKDEYGPTTRNDSLWKVAEKVNQYEDVSVEQMMMALYKANPTVFYKKNVNALMAGETLKIPQKTEIIKLSKAQARSQFNRQMVAWEGRIAEEPEHIVVSELEPQVQEASDSSTKLTLESPSEDAIAQSAALTANTTEAENLATENLQLQERLANLEKQFAIMQEIMAIKDQQLAAMQNAQLAPELKYDTSLDQNILGNTEGIEEQENSETISAEPSASIESTVQAEQDINSQEYTAKNVSLAKEELKQTSVDKGQADNDSGINYFYFGTGLLVLFGFSWLLGRRRQTEEEINENSIFSSARKISAAGTQEKITLPVLDKNDSYDIGAVGESSFLSEFAPGDFDVFESDHAEVDPSSETDVYLAYGRYQQAEALMRHAIADHPEKDEYKLKLLEIFYASENKVGFENYANELVALGMQTDIDFWSKVSEMGKELIPDCILFSTGQGEAEFEAIGVPPDDYLNASHNIANDNIGLVAEAISKSDSKDSKSIEADFDLNSLSIVDSVDTNNKVNLDKADITEIDQDIESIDFDLSRFESIETSDNNEPDLVSDLETIDFNSSDITEPKNGSESVKLAENNDFDFDFDFDEVPAASAIETTDSVKNDTEVSDLTDMDEFETKIDLAKAYIDMGDDAAAKSIAQEVLAQGNDAQKLEAQTIIDRLS
ncbi:FimV/HubP family polar landmark protein [Methyloprofundus sedimenti]|nr:FimV/HubP family polar landmark protein [Methyloprofundus sedimenti]